MRAIAPSEQLRAPASAVSDTEERKTGAAKRRRTAPVFLAAAALSVAGALSACTSESSAVAGNTDRTTAATSQPFPDTQQAPNWPTASPTAQTMPSPSHSPTTEAHSPTATPTPAPTKTPEQLSNKPFTCSTAAERTDKGLTISFRWDGPPPAHIFTGYMVTTKDGAVVAKVQPGVEPFTVQPMGEPLIVVAVDERDHPPGAVPPQGGLTSAEVIAFGPFMYCGTFNN